MQSMVQIGPAVLEKIFKFRQYISLFRNYFPLEQTWIPFTGEALCQFGRNWPSSSGKENENMKRLQ